MGGSKTAPSTSGKINLNKPKTSSIDSDEILPLPPPPPPPPLCTRENISLYFQSVAEPQYITAETVRQNKLSKRSDSPDNDSAFCDNISSNSSNDSSKASPSTGAVHVELTSCHPEEDSVSKAKAEKIRLAIEKIKEASIKKIFIKVFSEDGSAKSLLVDERMTVAQVCRMLAEKNHQVRSVLKEHMPSMKPHLSSLTIP